MPFLRSQPVIISFRRDTPSIEVAQLTFQAILPANQDHPPPLNLFVPQRKPPHPLLNLLLIHIRTSTPTPTRLVHIFVPILIELEPDRRLPFAVHLTVFIFTKTGAARRRVEGGGETVGPVEGGGVEGGGGGGTEGTGDEVGGEDGGVLL